MSSECFLLFLRLHGVSLQISISIDGPQSAASTTAHTLTNDDRPTTVFLITTHNNNPVLCFHLPAQRENMYIKMTIIVVGWMKDITTITNQVKLLQSCSSYIYIHLFVYFVFLLICSAVPRWRSAVLLANILMYLPHRIVKLSLMQCMPQTYELHCCIYMVVDEENEEL